jgi:ATP-dependent RNA helicase DeaD
MTFAELSLPETLLSAITARGYQDPTPVQEAVLAPALAGRDLLVSSRTGSGKTVAFGLLLSRELLGQATRVARAQEPQALVVAPTRELALQVATELGWLFAGAGARIATCVGGVDMGRELRTLRDGPHIVVGTPGRLVDHLERKSLRLASLRALVLDEADEMLDMGFREELERILRDAPEGRRTLLFSATVPDEIAQLAQRYQRDAARVVATPMKQAHQDIEVRAHLIASREREHAVVNTLRAADAQSAIVFCGTRDHVAHLHASLVERGFAAVALSGELTQPERTRALQALRDGRARVLVATDVAARGLDLPDVGIVVQADLPQNAEVWQHRSGRTGRAGRKGVSVLLVPAGSQRTAERILRTAGARPSWGPVPGPEEIRRRDQEQLVRGVAELLREPAEDDLAVARDLLSQHGAEQLAAALVKLRREGLPAPEELPLSAQILETAHSKHPRAAAAPRAHAPRPQPHAPRSAVHTEAEEAAPARSSHVRGDAARGGHPARPAAAHAPRPAAAHAPRQAAAHPAAATAREARPARTLRDHKSFSDAVWFRVDVGRGRNADPRWLLPLLCRRGGVVKEQIGKIQIMQDETRFQVVAAAASSFERAARRPDAKDPSVHIGKVQTRVREG